MTGRRPQDPPSDAVESATASPGAQVMALTQELMRRMVALAGDLTASSGLNPSDVAALRALDAAAGEGVAVNTLGAQLGLSSGATTALVDRLEHHELVQRNRDPRDRRRVIVTLAPKAHAFGAQHLVPLAQAIQRATAELGDPELAAVEHFLELLLDAHRTPASPHTDPAPAASDSTRR